MKNGVGVKIQNSFKFDKFYPKLLKIADLKISPGLLEFLLFV